MTNSVGVRLNELLTKICAVDNQLVNPLSLSDSIAEFETTIEAYDRIESEE